MQNSSSFIDLVVRDSIREHFVSGSVLAITDGHLDKIIWANAAGANAFANETLVEAIDAPTLFSRSQKRQVLNGLNNGIANMVRIGARLVPILASHIELEAGQSAILLSAPNPNGHITLTQRAKGMVDGLEQAQSRAAIIKSDGSLVAATERFVGLDISPTVIRGLISEVLQEEDRLVKRPVHTALGHLPSAIARLDDDLHLLMVVMPLKNTQESDQTDGTVNLVGHPKEVTKLQSAIAQGPYPAPPLAEAQPIAAFTEPNTDLDHHGDESLDTPQESADSGLETEQMTLPTGTQRFVWKTDRSGELLEASDAFTNLLAQSNSQLIGRPFAAIMAEHSAESANLIGLMARQDTWSGREIMIKLKDHNLAVPVVLSALPQRDRDNAFAGYRGFGLIRFENTRVIDAAISAKEDAAEITSDVNEPETPKVLGVADVFSDEHNAQALLPLGAHSNLPEQSFDAQQEEALADEEQDVTAEVAHDETDSIADDYTSDSSKNIEGQEDDTTPPALQAEVSAIDEVLAGDLNEKERETFAEIRRQLIDNAPAASAMAAARLHKYGATSLDTNDVDSTIKSNVLPVKFGKASAAEKTAALKANNQTLTTTPRFMPSAFAAIDLLPRKGDIELSVLDQLPLAVMLQRGDDVIYANDRLLDLSGFDDLGAIAEAGGLEALFEEPELDDQREEPELRSVMRLKRPDNDGLDAEAHIQVISFKGSRALLLALLPIQHANSKDTPVDKPETTGQNNDTAPSTTLINTAPSAIFDTAETADPATLKAQIEELHSILDTATDGVILLDDVANIRSINKSAEALFGYGNEVVRSKPFTTLFAIESHRSAMEYLTALTDNGVASVMNDGLEVIGREKEGRFIPLFMTLGRLAGSNGYCAVLRDITAWKRAEENLTLARRDAESASTQKTAFLARISHEIRTPLNAIIGFSDLMLDERFGSVKDDRSREYLKDINKSGGLVLDLVNDLLDLSKIEAGEQELEFSAVSINELLRESVSMMQPKANQQRVIIRSSLSGDLPDVVADARSIKQIALNLLSNAVRFTNPGGQVVVSSALMDDGCLAIRFRDTGIGMTEEQIEQAMQPYKQVHSEDVIATKDGSGLGLPLTKAMVEGNRADIMITSTPNVGTIVEVIFPANRVLSE